jgi:hypothetical protein
MANEDFHTAAQQLLLYADGELSSRDASRIRTHLALCWECRARMTEIEAAIAGFMRVHREAREDGSDAAGPRALLRARLAQVQRAQGSSHGWWRRLRLLVDIRGLAYAFAGLLVVAAAGVGVLHQQQARERVATLTPALPNPGITPGATRQVAFADLCANNSDEVVRAVPETLQHKVFREYGIEDARTADYEVDYLITPGLGGSDDVRNLWPEPHHDTTWNSYVKDELEDHLHHLVCGGKLNLDEAQKDIANNWILAYKKYFHTDQPIAHGLPSGEADIDHHAETASSSRASSSIRERGLIEIYYGVFTISI